MTTTEPTTPVNTTTSVGAQFNTEDIDSHLVSHGMTLIDQNANTESIVIDQNARMSVVHEGPYTPYGVRLPSQPDTFKREGKKQPKSLSKIFYRLQGQMMKMCMISSIDGTICNLNQYEE